MKLSHLAIASIFAAGALIQSCDDTTSSIGTSLVQDQVEIVIDSTFTVSGQSVSNRKIQSRTITQVLGKINAEGYGSFQSDFVTQFMPVLNIDTTNVQRENIDSLRLFFLVPHTEIVGDSLLPMGLDIYRLNKELPSPIYSTFSPEGYYDKTKVMSHIYKANAIEEGDTLFNSTTKYIMFNLPREMALELYDIYKENPANYATPQAFVKKFPGFYVKNSYGSGRVVRIAKTVMRMYYHKNLVNDAGRDTTIRYVGYYYGVQPEVVTNNIIDYQISPVLERRINDGEHIIVAPAGRDVEIRFPAPEVLDAYKNKAGKLAVINGLTFRIPAIEIDNDYSIEPPSAMLMILSKDKDKFFVDNEINNDVTSFIARYNSTTKSYNFDGMRAYMLDLLKKENITPEDYTFTLTPVSLMTTTDASTSYYYYYYSSPTEVVNAIVPYVSSPTMVQLDLKKSKIILTFSKQLTNF